MEDHILSQLPGRLLPWNERANTTRLMKVKDMMLEEAHHYSEREQ